MSDVEDRCVRAAADSLADEGRRKAANQRDAARYRWLRDRYVGVLVREGIEPTWSGWLGQESLDEEIDRRMELSSATERG